MTEAPPAGIVIIGGGQAAVQASQSLRKHGYDRPITIVADEDVAPYQRPPLSKAFLKGDMARERLALKPEKFYQDREIDLRLGVKALKLDRQNKRVELSMGEALPYEKLILATGATPRVLPLPGAELENVVTLKTIADTDRLRPLLAEGKRLMVIGGGYIGLECAATARTLGLQVTLVERMPRLLARVTSEPVSAFFHEMHASEGVSLRYEEDVTALVGENGAVTGVKLASGETVQADMVLVGIGVVPNQQLGEEAGLACENGILTDLDGLTSDPYIYAIGDCACHPVPGYGDRIRLESVHNAMDQGDKAAAHICRAPRPVGETPWFWSDQYDVKLQTVGLFNGFDDYVVRGAVSDRKYSVFYFKQGKLLAVDSINDVPSYMAAKQILKLGIPLSIVDAGTPDYSLKDHIKAFKSQQAV